MFTFETNRASEAMAAAFATYTNGQRVHTRPTIPAPAGPFAAEGAPTVKRATLPSLLLALSEV